MGAYNALNTLRDIGRALRAWAVPLQVSIPEARKHFDQAGTAQDCNW